jgi:alcohol dehydrogenase class IV
MGTSRNVPEYCDHLAITAPVILIDRALSAGAIGAGFKELLPGADVVSCPPGEPSSQSIAEIAAAVTDRKVDGIVAVGGGSTIDTAKLARGYVSAGVSSPRDLPDQLPVAPLPLIAVATTAGTGAEMGAGAIVFDPAADTKILVRRAELAADVAIADGELTLTLPPDLTAFTGCDALAQAILAYVGARWEAISGQMSLRAIRLIWSALPRAVADGRDPEARRDQMLGSALSAISMYTAPPTYAGEHVFAEPIGAALRIPHGRAVALFLPGTAEFNEAALAGPYADIARELGLADETAPDLDAARRFVEALREFVRGLEIPPLRESHPEADLSDLVGRSRQHEAWQDNPRPIGDDDAAAIVRGAADGTFSLRYAAEPGAR